MRKLNEGVRKSNIDIVFNYDIYKFITPDWPIFRLLLLGYDGDKNNTKQVDQWSWLSPPLLQQQLKTEKKTEEID